MIRSFRHPGIELLFKTGNHRGVVPQQADRLQIRLALMHQAKNIQDINQPGWRFHALAGDLAGYYSIRVTANYRIIFRWDADTGDCTDVDLIDYHGN